MAVRLVVRTILFKIKLNLTRLLGQSGAAAAVLNPPGDPPDGSEEDDQQCSPKPKCGDSSCGGANGLGLCKSGDKANCMLYRLTWLINSINILFNRDNARR